MHGYYSSVKPLPHVFDCVKFSCFSCWNRVPKIPGSSTEWLPVKPGNSKINYMEIYSPTKTEMKSSSDFGQRSFWDNLGLNENEHYRAYVKDEL